MAIVTYRGCVNSCAGVCGRCANPSSAFVSAKRAHGCMPAPLMSPCRSMPLCSCASSQSRRSRRHSSRKWWGGNNRGANPSTRQPCGRMRKIARNKTPQVKTDTGGHTAFQGNHKPGQRARSPFGRTSAAPKTSNQHQTRPKVLCTRPLAPLMRAFTVNRHRGRPCRCELASKGRLWVRRSTPGDQV